MSNSETSIISEIVEREMERLPKIENIEGYYSLVKEDYARAACLAVAKAVVEECAKIAGRCECNRAGCSCADHAEEIRALGGK